jgi:hypothetical protein
MRLNPRAFRASFAASLVLGSLLGAAALGACGDGTFPNALNVYDPDASHVVVLPDAAASEDANATDATANDAGDANAATDAGAADADGGVVHDGSVGDASLLDAGDASD